MDIDEPVDIGAPPQIGPANPMPMDWNDHIPRHRALWEKAEQQHYDPNRDIEWDALNREDFSDQGRLAIAYWFATGSVFENSGTPTFGLGMIRSYEEHVGDATSKMLLTIARDEANHDEMSRRIVEKLLPGFPNRFSPSSALETAAWRNLQWIQYTNSRYWDAFKRGFNERRPLAHMSNFAVGEAAASLIYMRMSNDTEHSVLQDVLRHIGVDESRHFACFNFMAQEAWGGLTDEEKFSLAKGIKASYIYISVVFGDPMAPFWDVPDGFRAQHDRLQRAAYDAGLGAPPREERDEIWRKAMLRVKAVGDKFDLPWPRIEELDIDGDDVPITEEDLVVVSF